MPKHLPLRITIPNPCHQKWEEMTPCGQGRFCGHCQKTVIDFTTWSDAALYRFFSKNKEGVCGRFLSTQTNRYFHIPPQPHSRLYRMTIALGLTLLFTQATDVVAHIKAPLITQSVVQNHVASNDTATKEYGELRGQVLDENKEPVLAALVQLYQGSDLKGSDTTDYSGNYTIKLLASGEYEMIVRSSSESSRWGGTQISPVQIHSQAITTQNVTLVTINVAPMLGQVKRSRGDAHLGGSRRGGKINEDASKDRHNKKPKKHKNK